MPKQRLAETVFHLKLTVSSLTEDLETAHCLIIQCIKAVRDKSGFTQRQLARRAKYSTGYIAQIESGNVPLTPNLVRRLLKALSPNPPKHYPTPRRSLRPPTIRPAKKQ